MFDKKKTFSFVKKILVRSRYAFTKFSRKGTAKDISTIFESPIQKQGQEKPQTIFIVWDYILLFLIYILLFSSIKMSGVLEDSIPIGGDIPFHFANYIDLKEIFLPNLEISGWSDASFGGYNTFQSYPILPFFLIYLLDIFVASGVAFKVVLLIGAIGLPISIYWALLQTKVPRPGPIFGAILSLAYLFHDDHFAFGGNLESVFSGEFAHSLSILFLVFFCGFLFRAFEEKKYSIHAIIILAIIGFTHPVSFAVAFFLPLFFLIENKETKLDRRFSQWDIAGKIILISGLLFCTWAIGYGVIDHYGGIKMDAILSNSYGWSTVKANDLIPRLLLPFALLFLGIVTHSIFYAHKISRTQALFLWGFLVSMIFFLLKFKGFAVRFLPGVYLFAILFISATVGIWYQNAQKAKTRMILYSMILVSLLGIYGYAKIYVLFEKGQSTSSYIFGGAQALGEWESVTLVSKFLSQNFDTQTEKERKESYPPRIFSVYKGDLFRVTSQATLYDSLFSESFFNTKGKWTVRQIKEKRISPEKIWSYMELSNVHIIIATQDLAEYLKNTPYFSVIKSFGIYTVLQLNKASDKYVVPLRVSVYAIPDLEELMKMSPKWYREYTQKFPFIKSKPFFVYDPLMNEPAFIPYTQTKMKNITIPTDCMVDEFVERKKISIETNCIGRPLLVKFAYHPNWHVVGAKNIYLATPGFMIIVPEEQNVTLYYGKKSYNYLAYICGILGIFLLFSYKSLINAIVSWNSNIYKKYNKYIPLSIPKRQKKQLKKIGIFLSLNKTCILFTLTLLLMVMFVYSGNRW